MRDNSLNYSRVFSAMHGLLSKMNIFLELTHNEATKRAVESEIGIGCLSQIALESDIKSGNLVPLELPRREMHRSVYFVLRKKRHPSKAVDWWIELCQQS